MIFIWGKRIDPSLLSIYFEQHISPERLLFFDIETTGLGFTKTNFIFLIGLGTIKEGNFFIKQFVIPEKGREEETYKAITEEIKDKKVIFTYNGERFDIPLLIKRLKMHGKLEYIEKLSKLYHIDLLKLARGYWKKKIGSCSLGNVEKRVLNIFRNDDLPGFLVPTYFDLFLRERDMKYLDKILKHNRQDILSLYYILENIIKEDITHGKKRISLSTD